MSLADFWVSIVSLFVPVLSAVAFLCAIMVAVSRVISPVRIPGQTPFLISFGFLGGISGLIAGVSQQSIVQALLTGMLGIISSLLMYLLSRDSLKEWRQVIPIGLILLLISTLAGLSIGGSYKAKRTEFERAYNRRLMLYEKVDLAICKEERLMRLQGKSFPADYKSDSCPAN